MFSNNNRGPLQPSTVMTSTGREYKIEAYGVKTNGQRYKVIVTRWSADCTAHTLTTGFGNAKTTLQAMRKGNC